jgi:hypothetical protein
MPAPTTVQPVSLASASMRLVVADDVVHGKVASSQVVTTLMPRCTHFSTMGAMSSTSEKSVTMATSGAVSSRTRSASSEILTPSLTGSPAQRAGCALVTARQEGRMPGGREERDVRGPYECEKRDRALVDEHEKRYRNMENEHE